MHGEQNCSRSSWTHKFKVFPLCLHVNKARLNSCTHTKLCSAKSASFNWSCCFWASPHSNMSSWHPSHRDVSSINKSTWKMSTLDNGEMKLLCCLFNKEIQPQENQQTHLLYDRQWQQKHMLKYKNNAQIETFEPAFLYFKGTLWSFWPLVALCSNEGCTYRTGSSAHHCFCECSFLFNQNKSTKTRKCQVKGYMLVNFRIWFDCIFCTLCFNVFSLSC